jgi:hypothetical protein
VKGAQLSTERVGVSIEAISAGVVALGENAGRAVSAECQVLFHKHLSDRMTPREWVALVDYVIERHRSFGGWACVGDLIAYLDEMRAAVRAEGPSEDEMAAAEAAADLEATR